jgi:LuxR family transcriptional regulator, maltose regulon positive regulatory protein
MAYAKHDEQARKGDLRAGTAFPASSHSDVAPLETKFHPPPVRKNWVQRRDLIHYLDGAQAKLVLVSAPPGYGKTVLLAEWMSSAAESRSFAWITLDQNDDAGRLWWQVVYAVQRACPEFGGEKLLHSLRSQDPDINGTFLPSFVNALTALAAPLVIVLDDYHVIEEPSWHDQLAFLLLHLPHLVKIALSTRTDPPLSLGRLRATGNLAEIRMKDLRLTQRDAAELIRATAAVELDVHDLLHLVERTEGWPAGLYLAAISLRDHPDPGSFIRHFAGSNRYVADFLAQEVINGQPRHIQQFLARTAVLGLFSAQICGAVAGIANAHEIIDVLERENLFLVAMDDNREWFRFHHLFAETLLHRLSLAEPSIVPVLHQRASEWHRRWGSAEEATGHALAAGDVAGAVDLIASHWCPLVNMGRIATVRTWLRSLRDDHIGAYPVAAHCTAWVAGADGERETVRRCLSVMEADANEGPLPDGVRSLASSAALVTATFGFTGLGPMRQSAIRALDLENDPGTLWHVHALIALGAAFYFFGEFSAAARKLERALTSKAATTMQRIWASAYMAFVAVEENRLAQAEESVVTARDLMTDPGLGLADSPLGSLAGTAAGALYAAQGWLKEARGELEHALTLRRKRLGLSQWPTLEILLRLAPVRQELGDAPGAARLLAEARELLTSFPAGAEAQLSRLARLEGRLAHPPDTLLSEPLTEREQAVLRLLRAPLSLREIQRELHVSANTIKAHTRAIYRKLGVSGRHEAVQRARELGFL